jgi:hypothetical protein
MTRRHVCLCGSLFGAAAVAFLLMPGCLPPANPAPVAQNQAVGVAPGGSIAITVVASDPDGEALSYNLVSNPAHGTLVGVLPTMTYTTTSATWTGCDQFTFSASDASATSNVATVRIAVGNQKPVAADTSTTATSGQAKTITLNGSDPDNCPGALTFHIVSNPLHGTLGTPSGTQVVYTPASDFHGTDTFTYKAFDGLEESTNTGTATISVSVGTSNRNIVLTLQNAMTDRYVHYHLILIAFAEDIVPGDGSRYEAAGYVHYATGTSIGCYGFAKDLYLYYHYNGKFRANISSTSSAMMAGIPPATSASQPRQDYYFINRQMPIPSVILFHDPGSTVPSPFNSGRDSTTINPALDDVTSCVSCTRSAQASWYYVTANDVAIGNPTACSEGRNDVAAILRYFRVPAETQDTACFDCVGSAGMVPLATLTTAHWMHNTAVGTTGGAQPAGNPTDCLCYEYYMDGFITYTFRNITGTTPGTTAVPSLVWDVRSRTGTIIHSPS